MYISADKSHDFLRYASRQEIVTIDNKMLTCLMKESIEISAETNTSVSVVVVFVIGDYFLAKNG